MTGGLGDDFVLGAPLAILPEHAGGAVPQFKSSQSHASATRHNALWPNLFKTWPGAANASQKFQTAVEL